MSSSGLKARKKKEMPTIKNPDRICVICGSQYKAVSPLQKTCSIDCRSKHYAKLTKSFKERNPDVMKMYNRNRVSKNPNVWKEKQAKDRIEIINALGGVCCVEGCGASNPNCLHADYIPTMQGTGFRHPRHRKWVMDNIKDFRLLCANHHYELSITGMIEGTNITQEKKKNK